MTTTSKSVTPAVLLFFFALAGPGTQDDLLAARLQPHTAKAWEQYLEWADAKVKAEVTEKTRFLIRDRLSAKDQAEYDRVLRSGRVYRAKMAGVVPAGRDFEVPDGKIHHWWGAVLVPNMKLAELLPLLQDYDQHAGRFAEVQKSRLVGRSGNTYRFTFRLKRVAYGVSAHYNTEQECTYFPLNPDRQWSRSIATRIAEIAEAGKPGEHDKPVGDDHGYLWRMVSWWRFDQRPEGVIVECESATLSRDVPFGLSWAIGRFIDNVAKDSLESVLLTVRAYGKDR